MRLVPAIFVVDGSIAPAQDQNALEFMLGDRHHLLGSPNLAAMMRQHITAELLSDSSRFGQGVARRVGWERASPVRRDFRHRSCLAGKQTRG